MVEAASVVYLQLVRMPLAEAGPEVRMVESLQSMWDEEKLRIGGNPPPPPPEPIRTAKPLCQHIEVVRAQLQVCFPTMLPDATLLVIVEAKLQLKQNSHAALIFA